METLSERLHDKAVTVQGHVIIILDAAARPTPTVEMAVVPQHIPGPMALLASLVPRQITTTTTIHLSTGAASTSSSSGILASAEASTHLSWWQLLCIVVGAVLAVAVGLWAWLRNRRFQKAETERIREIEMEEGRLKVAAWNPSSKSSTKARGKSGPKVDIGKGGRRGRLKSRRRDEWSEDDDDSDETGSESESYGSVSDRGTIRPKREKTRSKKRIKASRRRAQRRQVRDDDSEAGSETLSDLSDSTYYDKRRRREYRQRERERERERHSDRQREDRRRHRRRSRSLSPIPSSLGTSMGKGPSGAGDGTRSKTEFRDSVFSSYASMKKAAVRLKYVEAKVRLKKQLQTEEEIERGRQDRMRAARANSELEAARKHDADVTTQRDHELHRQPSSLERQGSTDRLMPRVQRPATALTSDSSSGVGSAPLQNQPSRAVHSKHAPGRNPTDRNIQNHDGLGDEINHLLRATGRAHPPHQPALKPALRAPSRAAIHAPPALAQRAGPRVLPPANNFVADWLAQPPPGMLRDVPYSPHARGSVYLPITAPKDRPIIPRGALAPAPPRKMKSAAPPPAAVPTMMPSLASGVAGNAAGVGSGSRKWADRLRERP